MKRKSVNRNEYTRPTSALQTQLFDELGPVTTSDGMIATTVCQPLCLLSCRDAVVINDKKKSLLDHADYE